MTSANSQFPAIELGALARYRVRGGAETPLLADVDPGDTKGLPFDKEEVKAATMADVAEIDRLQDILYAGAKHAILVVLQGLDTSGKDGTARKVFGPIDPLGVVATSFKAPTLRELAHDFLWRVHKVVPAAGMIGIFNRSHYEDVLVARVHELVSRDRIAARYDQINAFERHLAENGTVILKFFLHISKAEQKVRLQERLDDPTKRWKFSPGDVAERKHWDDYRASYQTVLERCSTKWAPWFIVPADRKWYRNAVVAKILLSTLQALHLAYPASPPGLDKIRIE
jgi:PPK2 family polyphosphate:nucleotide phosphotransferase